MYRVLLILCLVTGWHTVQGLTILVPSLEELSDTCPHIGIYQYKATVLHTPSDAEFKAFQHERPSMPRAAYEGQTLELALVKTLRGLPPAKASVAARANAGRDYSVRVRFGEQDQFLVFWREASTNDPQIQATISLTQTAHSNRLSVAVLADFSVVSYGKHIEKIVTERIAAKPLRAVQWATPGGGVPVGVPMNTPAAEAIGGWSTLLIVPPDLLPISKAVAARVKQEEDSVLLKGR